MPKIEEKISMSVISEIYKTKIFYNCSHHTHTHRMSRYYKWVALKSGGHRWKLRLTADGP